MRWVAAGVVALLVCVCVVDAKSAEPKMADRYCLASRVNFHLCITWTLFTTPNVKRVFTSRDEVSGTTQYAVAACYDKFNIEKLFFGTIGRVYHNNRSGFNSLAGDNAYSVFWHIVNVAQDVDAFFLPHGMGN